MNKVIGNNAYLTTIHQLETLVEIEKNNSYKELGALFMNAMNDWDSHNQTDILSFVEELKVFFDTPLTKDKIRNKHFDIADAWKQETGSSIIEMFDCAERNFHQSDFDSVFQLLIEHFEKELQNIDFIADLKYLKEGGRKRPAYSLYRPQVKFEFSERQTSGQQIFLDKEIVYPGDSVKAAIRIISVDFFSHQLKKGIPFEFREGSTIIGTGIITDILNPVLDATINLNS